MCIRDSCDSVLLYNDAVDAEYLGRKLNHGYTYAIIYEKNRGVKYFLFTGSQFFGWEYIHAPPEI